MPRQARLDTEGTLHHVIIRGIEKGSIFTDGKDRADFVARVAKSVEKTKTKVYAWALMPNHVHLLVESGKAGLPAFMRRVLTGYAITYNLRHGRHGHLFQNRYKSIVCDKEEYFQELVRYIHLNPIRAKLVEGLAGLVRYRWSGHTALMGFGKYDWQETEEVLKRFGEEKKEAIASYKRYISEGLGQGKRPELVGGGLIRSLGGWAEVMSLRRTGGKFATDERILGKGEFVEKLMGEADERAKRHYTLTEKKAEMTMAIDELCAGEGINIKELLMGSRRGKIPEVRRKLADKLVKGMGLPLAEAARGLGVSTSAISKMLSRASEVIQPSQ
jgi:putative transposase